MGAALAVFGVRSRSLNKRLHQFWAYLGLALVTTSYFLIHEQYANGRLLGLIPCLGAALVVANPTSLQVLSSKVIVHLGKLSYSIYLWHWPIMALWRYQVGYISGFLTYFGITALTLALAQLTWSLIENPIRASKRPFSSSLLRFWLIPTIGIFIFYTVTRESQGIPQRYFSRMNSILSETTFLSAGYCYGKSTADCRIGAKNERPATAMLWGDSHAAHYMPFWNEIGKQKEFTIEAKTAYNCAPFLTNKKVTLTSTMQVDRECPEVRKWVKDQYIHFDVIIIGGIWSSYFTGPQRDNYIQMFLETVRFFLDNHKTVIVMNELPSIDENQLKKVLRKRLAVIPALAPSWEGSLKREPPPGFSVNLINQLLAPLLTQFPQLEVYDPIPRDELSKSSPFLGEDLIYRDNNHLNEKGSKALARYALEKNLLPRSIPMLTRDRPHRK